MLEKIFKICLLLFFMIFGFIILPTWLMPFFIALYFALSRLISRERENERAFFTRWTEFGKCTEGKIAAAQDEVQQSIGEINAKTIASYNEDNMNTKPITKFDDAVHTGMQKIMEELEDDKHRERMYSNRPDMF
ncbi:hypothetical protein [Azospirillum sp. B510]|uniref:hypothetical protein n=1 Tax=Azospirillum sp. (strain B510) TaxID=137722 RepID=UPI0011D0BB69|nr:hypothetical protein [Azospirillum sp. B510]